MTSAIVLHDLGDPDGGAGWREVVPAGWQAPDLPGHGQSPAPRHGAYDPMGPATIARWELGGTGLVVGVGQNAHAALILAVGGGCGAVTIVDGLWAAWRSPDEQITELYAGLRKVLDDPGAIAEAPRRGLDPRARHGYGVQVSAPFCQSFWGSVSVPVLVVETPRSPTPRDQRAERASWFGGPSTLVECADDPRAIVDAVLSWQPATEAGEPRA